MDIGSKVWVTNDTDHHYGDIGTITEIRMTHLYPYGCIFPGRDFIEWYKPSELKEVTG